MLPLSVRVLALGSSDLVLNAFITTIYGVLMVSIGEKVADFSLPATGDKQLSLENFKGRSLVLCFYP
jgi:hypothetical protein